MPINPFSLSLLSLLTHPQDRKNALEEYIYDIRGKVDDRYTAYVQPQERANILALASQSEEWLYSEEGEDATKSAYVEKLDALKAIGDPVAKRYREAEDRPRVMAQLRETLNTFISQATSSDERYSHIDEKDKQSVIEKCATIEKWLDDQSARQAERPKNVDPILLTEDMKKKREDIIYFTTPIMTKPKPKPKVTEAAPKGETPNGTDTPTPGTGGTQTPNPEADMGPTEPTNMDVD